MNPSARLLAAPPDGAPPRAPSEGTPWASRAWAIVATLSITETVSWGILYYAFAVFLVPMRRELGYSTAQLTGAFSTGLLVSAAAGIAVGRYLDRHGPRPLMTAGSVAGTALVIAWSRVHGLVVLYALWMAIGLVMAVVLYEPAFTVLAKWFPAPSERRRAMTALTLVAALASFIFLPLSQALIDAHGWRDSLLILAGVLGVITVPLHWVVLRRPPRRAVASAARRDTASAGAALRSAPFWLLTGAFVLAALATVAMTVLTIPFLLQRGYHPGFAAFAVGLIGVSQIPGRLIFGPLAAWLRPAAATASVFVFMAIGVATVVTVHGTAPVVGGLVLLGMGNGMATLARATVIADLYGPAAYGAIASVSGSLNTAARALGPAGAALYAAAFGYAALLWALVALSLTAALLAYVGQAREHP